ncbi:MAG: putative cytosol aminopeptidase [Parcubacteria group bacterium]|nr:putative cytosol aminopeptidase [Parcubacteria group bacterium]
MKLTFTTNAIEKAPKGYVRVRLTEEPKGTKRSVRAEGNEWIEIGVGKFAEMTERRFVIVCRSIVQAAKQNKAKKIAVQFDATPTLFSNLSLSAEEASSIASQNFEMAAFEFRTFKTKPKEGWTDVEEILICGATSKSIEAAAKRGQEIGRAVNACRELSNTPGGDMTPKGLAKAAKDAAKGLPITITILSRSQMEKLGMGALLGVAKGSTEEPTFTVMEYKGAAGKPIVLAGKGITFDSGGLNLKPSAHIYEMHMDMSGAASVIHAVALAARLKVKKHVIGLIPAAENMPGNQAMRPGDVLKSLSGKTIEVMNTDAEGRLILADAITYAKRFKPSVVLDVATLTGAAVAALGLHASAVLTRDDSLALQLSELGERSGDYVWRLPMWEEYDDMVKGTFADLANVGVSRYGGATEGGIFLWQFAKELDCPWAHIDIAPRMTSAPGEELAKGAAGAPVRLLLAFIESWTTK